MKTARLDLLRHEAVRAELMFGLIDADRARLSQFLPWVEWTVSADDERAYVDAVSRQWETLEFFDYAMFREDEYLGNIGVHTIDWMAGKAELGYWILGPHEGQGYVSEACERLVELCFTSGFHRVEIRCNPANARSARVPRRLGFRLEACLRQNAVDQFGQHHDTLVFAKLADDADVPESARPACVKHWAESDEGPQAYYQNSLELFGSIARVGAELKDFEVRHLVLPPGQRAWWPRAERTRETLIFTLEGRPDLWLDGVTHPLVSGDVVTLPMDAEVPHTLINQASVDARVLIVRSRTGAVDAANRGEMPTKIAHATIRAESTVAKPPKNLA